jgi:predicted nucleic acid-binding protein
MGEETDSIAVADAGPIIHLHEISHLRLLGIFSTLHICQSVWGEVIDTRRVPETALNESAVVHRHAALENPAAILNLNQANRLHSGEVESLALCRLLNIGLLLTDDMAARSAATNLGIRPAGSLGIIVRAYYLKRISLVEAEESLEALYAASTLFVTRAIVELAIEQLRGKQ